MDKEKIIAILLTFFIIVGLIFIAPIVTFGLSYFAGWLAKITIGGFIVEGFSSLGLTVLRDDIPLIAGVIGWIAGFFSSTAYVSKQN